MAYKRERHEKKTHSIWEQTIICGFKNIFVEFDKSKSGNVTFGDVSKILVRGKGKILNYLKKKPSIYLKYLLCPHEKWYIKFESTIIKRVWYSYKKSKFPNKISVCQFNYWCVYHE